MKEINYWKLQCRKLYYVAKNKPSVYPEFSFLFPYIIISLCYKENLIKTKYFPVRKEIQWPISAIFKPGKRGHNILKLVDILRNFPLVTCETECDY